MTIIIRVIEQDMAPSILIFFCVMGLGQFYVFAAVMAYLMLLVSGLLVLAYKMVNVQMIRTLRILLVIFTLCAFMNIFIDDMIFSDFDNKQLHILHLGDDYNETSSLVDSIIASGNSTIGSGNWQIINTSPWYVYLLFILTFGVY